MARARAVDVLETLDREDGQDQEMQALLLQAYIGTQLAHWVYDVRMRAGLSQRQLAEKIGSSQPAIARLEDSDYTGHSLKVVTRIAVALGESLVIDVHPQRYRGRRKATSDASPRQVHANTVSEGRRTGLARSSKKRTASLKRPARQRKR